MDYEINCNDEVAFGSCFLLCVFVFICGFWMDNEIYCNDQVAFGSSLALVSCPMSILFAPSCSVFSLLFVSFWMDYEVYCDD